MKKALTQIAFVLLLVACTPAQPKPEPKGMPDDPISLQATADALILSARSLEKSAAEAEKRIKATEKAYNIQATRLAQAITATAQAINVQGTAQAIQATANAQELETQSTATAQVISLIATATAEAIAVHREQAKATATAQAILSRQQAELEARKRSQFAAEMRLYLGLTFLFGVMVILLYLLWRMGERYLDALINRKLLVESRAGTLLLQPAGVQMNVMVITPNATTTSSSSLAGLLEKGDDDEGDEFESEISSVPYYVNGDLQGFLKTREAPRDEPKRKLALKLLREAIQVAGAESKRLPGWRELNWSAQTWSDAVSLLRPYLKTEVGRTGGTCLVGGYTLRDLYLGVGERRIALNTPTPVEDVVNVQLNER